MSSQIMTTFESMRPIVLSHLEFTILWESYNQKFHLWCCATFPVIC